MTITVSQCDTDDLAVASRPAGLDVVCFSDTPWDYALWTNRQHVMYRLPRQFPYVRVLYVAPPRWIFSKRRGHTNAGLTTCERSATTALWTRQVADGVWVLQPLIPVPNRVLRKQLPRLLDLVTLVGLRAALKKLQFHRPVVWTYTPFVSLFIGHLDERLVCYDVVDDYPMLPFYQGLKADCRLADRELLQRADIVFFSSKVIYNSRRGLNSNSHFLGNAADVDLFSTAQTKSHPIPADLIDIPAPLVCFHGAITAYKLDLPLICELARSRPRFSFVFIGPVLDNDSRIVLEGLSNVHLLGAKSQTELPAYLAHASVSIIPYQRNGYTEGINALKLYECLAAGTPVVATSLPCFQDFSDLVYLADDAASFAQGIVHSLTEAGPELATKQLAIAQEYSWDRKVARMMELVTARLRSSVESQ